MISLKTIQFFCYNKLQILLKFVSTATFVHQILADRKVEFEIFSIRHDYS